MMRRQFSIYAACVLLSLLCGCDDGSVPASGTLLIEGKPATGGQLLLTPVGKGHRAVGLVDENGAFALVSTKSETGVFPGSYHVMFKQAVQLSAAEEKRVQRSAGLELQELTVSYLGPQESPLVIPEAGNEAIEIDVRRKQGWLKRVGD